MRILLLPLFILTHFFILKAQQPWSWKYPLPQGLDVYQIQFPSADTGFAVAENGVFLKSYDGGNNWIISYTDSLQFRSLFFLDNNTGFIGGITLSSIFKTTDGGNTWTTLHVDSWSQFMPFYEVKEIYFKNSLIGFINGGEYYTVDGGITWTSNYAGTHLHFLNSNLGFAVSGSTVKYTVNGGTTWQNTGNIPGNLMYEITALQFTSPDTGYAVRQSLFKTIDGGFNWFALNSGNYVIKDLHFINNLTGVISGDNILGYTIDGGLNFNHYSIPGSLITVHCPDNLTCYASGSRGIIAKTSNGGISWNLVKEHNTADLLKAIDVKDDIGIAIGSSTILRSVDSGENWSLVQGVSLPTFFSVKIVSPQNILIGSHYIYQSNDTGQTWNNVTPTINTDFNDFSFINSTTGFAAGIGNLLKTTDGGNTWNLINNITFNDISFLDNNIGYGINNQFNKTTDGGITWTAQQIPGILQRLHFTSNDTGYISILNGTSGSTLLRTTDGGVSLLPVYFDPISNFHFIDNDTGFVLFNHIVKYTVDAGQTWSILPSNPASGNNFEALHFINSNTGYIAGSYNNLLKYNANNITIYIYENMTKTELTIYPNPVSNNINIDYENINTLFKSIKIYDITGKIIHEIKSPSKNPGKGGFNISVENFENGVYIIKSETKEHIYTNKIIINK